MRILLTRVRATRGTTGILAVLAVLAIFGVRGTMRAQEPSPFDGSRVAHVGVIVRDPAAAAKVYAEVFGVTVAEPADLKGKIDFPKDFHGDRNAVPRYTFTRLADVGIEILSPVGGASPWREYLEKYGDGLHHIAFYVRDVPRAAAHLQSLGGTLELGGTPGVGYAYVNFRDRLGFTVELVQMPASPAPAAPPDQSETAVLTPRIGHVGIIVPDVVKTAQLFSAIVGMPAPQARSYPGIEFPKGFTGDPKAHPKIISFPMNVGIEFAEPQGGASPWRDYVQKYGPAMHHLGIGARADMAQTVSALEKMGGTVLLRAPGGVTTFVDLKPRPMAIAIEVGGPPKN